MGRRSASALQGAKRRWHFLRSCCKVGRPIFTGRRKQRQPIYAGSRTACTPTACTVGLTPFVGATAAYTGTFLLHAIGVAVRVSIATAWKGGAFMGSCYKLGRLIFTGRWVDQQAVQMRLELVHHLHVQWGGSAFRTWGCPASPCELAGYCVSSQPAHTALQSATAWVLGDCGTLSSASPPEVRTDAIGLVLGSCIVCCSMHSHVVCDCSCILPGLQVACIAMWPSPRCYRQLSGVTWLC